MKYELEIKEFESVRMVGKKIEVKLGGNAKKHWKKYLSDGSNEFLQTQQTRVSPKGDTIGWMGNFNPETKMFTEMPGVFMNPKSVILDDYDYIDIPKCLVAILWIEGDNPNLERGAHNILLKHLKKTSYIADYSYGFSMEYYSNIGYVNLDIENPVYRFGYFLPIKPL